MATTKYSLTSAWTIVATSTQEFIAENTSSYSIEVAFNTVLPGANDAYHVLHSGQAIARIGVAGNLYARDTSGDVGTGFIVVTTS